MRFAEEIIERVKDMYDVSRVYGEPIERDGVTIIPAARLRGGAGGGAGVGTTGPGTAAGEETDAARAGEGGMAHIESGEGSGGGFGIDAKPVGAWVITADGARWRPAIDWGHVLMGGIAVMLAAVVLGSRGCGGSGDGCRRG